MGEILFKTETSKPMNLRSEGTKTVVIPNTAMVIPATISPIAVTASRSRPDVAA